MLRLNARSLAPLSVSCILACALAEAQEGDGDRQAPCFSIFASLLHVIGVTCCRVESLRNASAIHLSKLLL